MTADRPRERMPEAPVRQPQAKLCLVGEERVGKTSLVHRFAHGVYSPEYLRTIGALVTKKKIALEDEDGVPVALSAMIWDVMGKHVFLDLLGEAYFSGVQGVVAVFDLTRPESLEQLRRWIAEIQDIAPGAPVVLLANKSDMGSWRKIEDAAIESFAKEVGAPWYLTSAKTGENVDKAFLDVASAIRRNQRTSVPRA